MVDAIDFDKLVERFYEPLYQFAYSLSRDEADSCDLVQQTFSIWSMKGQQLRDPSKVKTWLFTTLHREFLGIQRKKVRFNHVELDETNPDLPSISHTAVESLDAETVLLALAEVEEIYQAPVALFYLQDFSYNEIGAVLNIPLGTVKSRLARGLARLQSLLIDKKPMGGLE